MTSARSAARRLTAGSRPYVTARAASAQAAWALSYFGPEAKKTVPDLVDYLRMAGDVRHEPGTVRALGRIGPAAAPAIPILIPGYLAEGCNLAKMGTFLEGNGGMPGIALAGIGAPAVPALIDVLTGPNTEMRACAALTLSEIGPAAKAAVPALVRALRAEERLLDNAEADALRRYAIIALGRIGPDAKSAVPALNALLDRELASKDTLYPDEWPMVEALDRIGAPPVAKLVEAFLREAGSSRGYELAKLGPRARAAIPALRKALTDPRLQVRIDAAEALTSIDPPAPDAVRVLIAVLDPYPEEAYEVPEALGRLGPAARAALPVLIGLLDKGTAREDVIEALVRIDPEGRVCIPALIKALGDKESSGVDAAARALGLLGPRARQAVPALAATLSRKIDGPYDNEGDPIVDAAKALVRIGPEARSAIPALIDAVKRGHGGPVGFGGKEDEFDYESTAACARVLGAFGPAAKAAVPVLIGVLRDHKKGDEENWEVRREAALALGRIGPDAKEAISVLRKVVDEGPPPKPGGMRPLLPMQVSDAAVIALFHLAPDGKDLAEAWAEQSASPERKAVVLGAMGRKSLEGELIGRIWLEYLNGVLSRREREGDDTLFVEEYFERLARLGVGAGVAVPRLKELLQHRNPWIRQWAGETLGKITKTDTRPAGS